jgi:hypothetical protein
VGLYKPVFCDQKIQQDIIISLQAAQHMTGPAIASKIKWLAIAIMTTKIKQENETSQPIHSIQLQD